jgi:hypothetical protein
MSHSSTTSSVQVEPSPELTYEALLLFGTVLLAVCVVLIFF